ncbi:3-isopropylmalate dehydratase large subunit, chloroplastic-like isoform X1 [Pyrus x bretschneideri]|uniref:3-isopropylmalate dehydratase large subunit, chloroplastic-like isoform X1 n=1 Tax=Pyrus x bretschneideri TaxID=225117 RepID=UPI00202E4155|nr:3-isopropylmalate dehydratase large subunit, chloroplastic-like isoform X1 [Pyrus x bretschneideri]
MNFIWQIIGEITVAGGTYKAMEFVGSTVESLSMEERMTLCNMVVEAGGKNGIVPADSTTFNYLEDKTSVPYEPVYSDAKARFLKEYRFDISKLEPLVAKPPSPDNRALARECKDVKIDRVYIGSCTGRKTEDFMAAARVFLASGKKVKVPTFLVPATQNVCQATELSASVTTSVYINLSRNFMKGMINEILFIVYSEICGFGWTCIVCQFQGLVARLAPRFLRKLDVTHLQVPLAVLKWVVRKTRMHA